MIYLALGLITLWVASELFVKYSCNIAVEFRVPKYIIGIVITSLGTSLPELVLSIYGALTDHVSLVIGNIVGSNIANIAVGLGLLSLLSAKQYTDSHLEFTKTDQHYLVVSTGFIVLGTFLDVINRPVAILMLIVMIFFLKAQFKYRDEFNGEDKNKQVNYKNLSIDFILLLFASGLIYYGAKWTIYGGVSLANFLDVPEFIIGLITIALGTSLPEIAVVVVSCRRGETSLALGNIIGSNIYNVCFILGLTALITPISIILEIYSPIIMYLIALTLLTSYALRYLANKVSGALLLFTYLIFVAWNFY